MTLFNSSRSEMIELNCINSEKCKKNWGRVAGRGVVSVRISSEATIRFA